MVRLRGPVALPLLLALAGCASGLSPPLAPVPAANPARSATKADYVTPSLVLPDLPATATPASVARDGTKQFLWMSMRVTERPDGSLQRANGMLPAGQAKLLYTELPSRLGDGYLFASTSAAGTQVWRAESWLAPLQPIVRFGQTVSELVPGFDRVYARSARTSSAFVAFDPLDGTWLDVGSLPAPGRLGPALFVDPWRAALVADLRGPLATFDAGSTWIPLPVTGDVTSIQQQGADILLQTSSGSLVLGTDGSVLEQAKVGEPAPGANPRPVEEDRDPLSKQPALPLGRRPLRMAVDRGYPYKDGRAVVASSGFVAIVSTKSGEIEKIVPDAYPKTYTSCQGIRLGRGVGFVCGQPSGATTVFTLKPSLALERTLHWPDPHAVFPSPNGSLVVRAPCPGTSPLESTTHYCVRDAAGRTRDLRFQGDVGSERIVPLSDGRTAILVAPRPGAEGRLVLLEGARVVTKALSFAAIPDRLASIVRRGLWLQGAQELRPGVIGVWVEAAGPVVGIHIDVEGRVRAGSVQPPSGSTVVSGRFGVAWKLSGEALETVDGGITWEPFEMPAGWAATADGTRGCSAVGCAISGIVRVGWGRPAEPTDLAPAQLSKTTANPPSTQPRKSRLRCVTTGRASPPPAPAGQGPPPASPPRVTIRPGVASPFHAAAFDSDPRSRGWIPFGSAPPPALAADELGVSSGRDYGDFHYRAYAWGPRSADWSRAGRWLVRVENPYDAVAAPWSTAVSASPWLDPASALIRVGNVTAAEMDPAGRAAILSWCPMPTQCQAFALSADDPPLALVTTDPAGLPTVESAVRTDDGWFFFARRAGNMSALWAADRSGTTRRIATFPRTGPAVSEDVSVVRASRGSGVALWTSSSDLQGNASWIVLPVDAESGRLTDAIVVGRTDFGGVAPPACAPDQQGWLVELPLPVGLELSTPQGTPFGGSIRVLLRAGAGWTCLQSISARAQASELGLRSPAPPTGAAGSAIPLVVWDSQENRRYELRCSPAP